MNEGLRRAWHPQRGERLLSRLKPGWKWLDDVPLGEREVVPLDKPGVHHRVPGGAWRKWRGPVRPVE